jgi:hypothetical protein
MANEKRIFTIQINGITESTAALSDLIKQLDELEKKIKALEKSNIKINSSVTGGSKGSKAQLSEEEKLQKQINKEIEKRAAMQTKEYQELLKQKKETKELADLQKLISKGDVVNEDGLIKFNQTIGGVKAELRALNQYIDTLKNPGEDWDGSFEGLEEELAAATERAGKLQERLKALEALKGVYGRNVGNYPGKDDTFPGGSEVVKYDTPKLKEYISTLKEKIKTEGSDLNLLKSLQIAMDALLKRTKTNTSEFKEYQVELSQVNDEINKLSGKNIQGLRVEDVIDPKINIELKELKQNLQFDDVNQAIGVLEDKLYAMSKAGEQTSEAFKEIQQTIIDLRRNVVDTDAVIDAMVSRTRGLDLTVQSFQALTAAMQVGAGVAGLFGKNEEELQKTIAKVTSLMSIAQGVQELYNQVTKKGTALNKLWQLSLAGAQKVINLFSKTQRVATAATTTNTTAVSSNAAATGALATATGTATAATGALSVAMNVLKVAIASTGIGLLVVALGSLVSWMMSASDETERFEKSMRNMEGQITATSNKLKNSFSDVDMAVALGNESELNGLLKKLKEVEKQYQSIGKIINDISIKQYQNSGTNKYGEESVKYGVELKEVSKRYDEVLEKQKIVINNTKEYEKELADIQASYVKLLTGSLVNTSRIEDQQSAMQELAYIFKQLNETAIGKTVSDNLENILPKKEDAERLKKYLTIVNEFGEEYINIEDDIRKKVGEIRKKTEDDGIEAINSEHERRLAEIKKNREAELKEVSHIRKNIENIAGLGTSDIDLKEAEAAINKKYDRQELETRKSFAKEIANVEKSIQANKIAVMKDSLDKTIEQLELNRKSEIEAAKETGIKVGEQTKAINEKYDAEILKAKENFYNKQKEAALQFASDYRKIASEISNLEYDIARDRVSQREDSEISGLSFDTDAQLQAAVDTQKKFYTELTKIQNEYIDRQKDIEIESTQYNLDDNLKEEKLRYDERLKFIENSKKEGLLTEEQYNKQIEDETEQHQERMAAITRQGQDTLDNIEIKAAQDKQKIIADSNANVIRSYNDYFNEIERLQSNSTSTNELTGIIDYKSTKQNLEKVKNEYSNLLKQINLEYDRLQKQFDNKEISFNDFQEAKKELKDLEQATNDAAKDVSQSMDELISDTIQSYTQMLGQGLQLIAEIWQTISDMRVAAIEAQISDLEDEYSELEKAYQKQEELAQRHTDKVSDIENELRTARGDRRAYLVEQLNSERRAQIEALQEEENIERKKQQNEKKQEALDKKRQREQKKAAKAQAIISGALTIANAFATAPFIPVGIAMGALATGLVAVQIAKINSTQYANGGLLNGKPHSQGGIPIGNTGIEVEGNEYVVNKKSTQANLPLIDYINSNRRKLTRDDLINFFDNGKQGLINKSVKNRYAEGGVLPEVGEIDVKSLINYEPEEDNRPIQVQVVDIINASENIRQVQTMAGL